MDWQQIISLCIVACTAVLLVGGKLKKKNSANPAACGNCTDCSAGTQQHNKRSE